MQRAEMKALERMKGLILPRSKSLSHILSLLAPVIVIVAVGLVPISWFEGGRLITFFDFDFPFPPFYGLEAFLYNWNGRAAPGCFIPRNLAMLPLLVTPAALNRLGIPLVPLEMAFFVSLTTISGLSMYYLFLTLFDTPYRRLGALTAALFYMVNPFVNNILWRHFVLAAYTIYAFTPLLLALYIKGLQAQNGLKYASTMALVSLAISPTGAGLAFAAPFTLIMVSYFVFSILREVLRRQTLAYILKFTLLVVILVMLVNAWWLLPQAWSFEEMFTIQARYRANIGQTNKWVMLFSSQETSFVNLFRLMGMPSFLGKDGDVPWYDYAPTYFTMPFILIGFLIPVLSFLGLLRKHPNQYVVYLGSLFVVSLFLLKGAHPPLGEPYIWAFDHIKWVEAFRVIYQKLGQLLPFTYALLLGLGVGSLYSLLSQLSKWWASRITALAFAILAVCVFGVYNFPYWTGEVIPPQGPIRGGGHVEVPAYYLEADAWLQAQGDDFRVFSLPISRSYWGDFTWEYGYWSIDPSLWLFSTPVIARLTNLGPSSLPRVIAERLTQGGTSNAACLLGLLNVRYVMLHGDASWQHIQGHGWWVTRDEGLNEEWFRNSLAAQEGLHWVKSIGKLHFYENERVFPHTYVTQKLTIVNGGLDTLTSQFVSCDPALPPAVFLTELQPDQANFAQEIAKSLASSEALPEITFFRLNPTAYNLRVQGASGPFLLVFGESYHPGWIARVDDEIINSHFLVNGYANAWYIDKEGDYEIAIRFKPQDFVWVGRGLSALGIILSGVGLIFGFRQ
ncbi:MAG: hypothetical protein ACUVV0_15075 [Anaerolineae bacterium]